MEPDHMVRWLTRFVGVFWTIAVALPSASAAEPLSGAMLVPPAGTIAHYTSTQVRFRAKEGLWVPLEVQASDQLFTGTPTGAAFGWLFEVPDHASAVFDVRAMRSLIPLAVGKRAETGLTRAGQTWRLTIEIMGVERVATPAGDFAAWLIRTTSRRRGGAGSIVTTRWYAPATGMIVRTERRSAGGTSISRLQKIVYPQTYAEARRATLRAMGEALYGESDYITAVYAWEKAAHWGDAGSMNALAKLHAVGNGVELDPVKAYMFFDLAARAGLK
jgi:hypothetical protein